MDEEPGVSKNKHSGEPRTGLGFVEVPIDEDSGVSKNKHSEEPSTGLGFVNFIMDEEPGVSENRHSEEDNARTNNVAENNCKCRKFCLFLKRFTTAKHPLPDNPTFLQKFRYAFLCPPHGILGIYITSIFLFGIIYAFLWSVFKEYALPFDAVFELWVHFVASMISGYLISLIGLPPLIGMLFSGIIMHLFPQYQNYSHLDHTSIVIRKTALTVLLLRAGLGLDPVILKKLSMSVLRLAFCPCIAEALTTGVVSHLILKIPIVWGLMLGFVIAAVSPAIVMPCMMTFQSMGLGTDKGIPTLLIASSSLDDVLAITGFGVALGIAFTQGSMAWAIVKGPLEALLGVSLGVAIGCLLWYLPSKDQNRRIYLKGFTLFSVGLMGIIGCAHMDVHGAGPLLCLTVAFTAGAGWRAKNEHRCLELINHSLGVLWFMFQPLLFCLIGASLNIHKLQAKSIGNQIGTLLIGLIVRSFMASIVVFGNNFLMKEKLFIAMAWLPKATVQAAIGSIALSLAQEQKRPDLKVYGMLILQMAVLAILITAPLGALLIVVTGPLLLKKTTPRPKTPEELEREQIEAM